MSEALRWVLVLGCLLLVALEAPQSSLVLVQDLRGPWCIEPDPLANAHPAAAAEAVERAIPTTPSPTLNPRGAFASVAPETCLVLERSLPVRLAGELRKGPAAIVIPR